MCSAARTEAPGTTLYLLAYYKPSIHGDSIRFVQNGSGEPNFPCDGSVTGQLSLDRRQCVDIIMRYGFRPRPGARR